MTRSRQSARARRTTHALSREGMCAVRAGTTLSSTTLSASTSLVGICAPDVIAVTTNLLMVVGENGVS